MDPARYLDLFITESREHLGAAWDCLARAEGEADEQPCALRELMRHAHSLKGMAATMGYEPMVGLAHALEDLFDQLPDRPRGETRAAAPLLKDGLACLERVVDDIERRRPIDATDAARLAAEIRALEMAHRLRDASHPPIDRPARAADAVPSSPTPVRRWRIELVLAGDGADGVGPTIAVLRRLASLGRVARVDPPTPPAEGDGNAPRLGLVLCHDGGWEALREALDTMEAVAAYRLMPEPAPDPAPDQPDLPDRWTRVRCALIDDLVERTLDLLLEQSRARAALPPEADRAGEHLARSAGLLRQLYATVNELRLVPFDAEAHRLHRAVHELSRALDRRVRFRIEGGRTRIDRTLLDALVDPLQHVVRNAMDHGIETAGERIAAGKPAEGSLTVRLAREREWIRVEIADDGRGIDPVLIRRLAVERGLLGPGEARDLDDTRARMLVTLPAFSTASRVTEISGRGVGMDVVRSAVERLGGRLEIDGEPGRGTTVRIRLPLDVTLVRALLVRCRGELYALPLGSVLRAEGDPDPLETIRLDARIAAAGGAPLPAAPERTATAGLTVDRGGTALRVSVDEIVGNSEIVVRPLHEPLDRLACYAGAALLDSGEIALVVDPYHL